MQKRSSTSRGQKRDINRLTKSAANMVVGNPIVEDPLPVKNPAAVALGRLGGLKGGKARAEKLSSRQRKAIAQKAAKARWSSKPSE